MSRPGLRPWVGILLVGLAGVLGSATVSTWRGIPLPAYHDEFSYLLAADTFAHGRLANPPHALWPHFESFHVLQQPTYASKYPPGQGLLLAAGTVVAGHPIAGVWLGVGLLGAAVTWMLLGWVPRRWALAGGCLAVLQLGLVTYWAQSYWGGCLAAAGGALLFGALPRLVRRPRGRDAVWLGVGLLLLANTRPYEGLVVSLVAAAWLAARSLGDGRLRDPAWWRRLVLPTTLVLAAGGTAMAVYNRAVTGDPLRFPYQVHEATYAVVPIFLWQELRPAPIYRHAEIERFHTQVLVPMYHDVHTVAGWWKLKSRHVVALWELFLGPVLSLPLVALAWRRRDPAVRFGLVLVGVYAAAAAVTQYLEPHYAAPIVGPVFLLVVQGLRQLSAVARRACRRHGGSSRHVAMLLLGVVFAACLGERLLFDDRRIEIAASRGAGHSRAEIEDRLTATGGRHLLLVRYSEQVDTHDEWVYNGAEIDAAPVIWARSMGSEADAALFAYYPERDVWGVRVGFGDPRSVQLQVLRRGGQNEGGR